jgi:hypothetical protein
VTKFLLTKRIPIRTSIIIRQITTVTTTAISTIIRIKTTLTRTGKITTTIITAMVIITIIISIAINTTTTKGLIIDTESITITIDRRREIITDIEQDLY